MFVKFASPLDQLKQRDLGRRRLSRRSGVMERLEPRRLFDAGDLDSTFGGDGRAATDLGPDTRPLDVIVQSDGKVVVAGHARSASGLTTDAILVRYNANGSLDSSFGTGGVARVDFGGNEQFNDLVVLGDGKIVAAGKQLDGKWMLARFTSGGQLDANSGFGGTDGIEIGDGKINGLTLQNGKILSGGDNVLRRHLATTGALDTTFGAGGTGTVVINQALISGLVDFGGIGDVDVQADGKILVMGSASGEPDGDSTPPIEIGIARLTANGAADTSFGIGGGVHKGFDFEITGGAALAVRDADGRIVVGGSDASLNSTVAAWNADGSFVGVNSLPRPINGSTDYPSVAEVMFDYAGRVIIAARADADLPHSDSGAFYVARYTLGANGSNVGLDRDLTFGGNATGFTAFAFDNPDSYSHGVGAAAMTPDGKIVVTGYGNVSDDGTYNLLEVARLDNGVVENAPATPQFAIEGGVLNVRGTNGNDTLFVRRSGADQVSIEVRYGNGQSISQSFDMDDFTGIRLSGFGGADAFNMVDAIVSPLVRNTTLVGGDGVDTVSYATRTAAIGFDVNSGDSTATSGAQVDHFTGVEVVVGGSGDDEFFFGDGSMSGERVYVFRFEGRGGNDRFVNELALGHDFALVRAYGGDGNDRFSHDENGNVAFYGEAGDDSVGVGEGLPFFDGGAGIDTINHNGEEAMANMALYAPNVERLIVGSVHLTTVQGNGMSNFIDASSQNGGVTVFGGGGNDTILGGGGNDSLVGGSDDDSLVGGAGNDTLDGTDGTDTLVGGIGNDTFLNGDSVDDLLPGVTLQSGTLRFDGTEAKDQISLWDDGNGGLVIWLDGQTHTVALSDVQLIVLKGNGGDDLLKLNAGLNIPASLDGGAGADKLIGGAGNDTLLGGTGADHLSGNGGNDLLDGGSGFDSDSLHGGAGKDTADYSARTANLVIGLDKWQDDGEAGEFDFAGPDIERVLGGSGNDRIGGSASNNELYGYDGNDTISGGGGNDALFGAAGNDKMDGGDGDDYLEGGAGHDTLYGGAGGDTLLGLAGNDRLLSFGDGSKDTVNGGVGTDSAEADDADDVVSVETVTRIATGG